MEVKTDMNQFFMLTKVYVKRLQLVRSSKTLKLKFPSLSKSFGTLIHWDKTLQIHLLKVLYILFDWFLYAKLGSFITMNCNLFHCFILLLFIFPL